MHCKNEFTVIKSGDCAVPRVKAVIFDFIGTLINVKGYDLEDSKRKLHASLAKAGFNITLKNFLDAYTQAHEKYRIVRYEQLVEVTNAIWISEALNTLGFQTTPDDPRIKKGVNIFFGDYLKSFALRPCVEKMLRDVSRDHKLGLVSNFTYAPVIYAGLRRLGINKFFNAVSVSEDMGWRKPHTEIFKETLRRLTVTAMEAVYVGDSPNEDIGGAKAVGIRTVYVPSQFYSLENLYESQQKPDLIVRDTCELAKKLPPFLKNIV